MFDLLPLLLTYVTALFVMFDTMKHRANNINQQKLVNKTHQPNKNEVLLFISLHQSSPCLPVEFYGIPMYIGR